MVEHCSDKARVTGSSPVVTINIYIRYVVYTMSVIVKTCGATIMLDRKYTVQYAISERHTTMTHSPRWLWHFPVTED